MAYLLSVTFSMPLRHRQTVFQGSYTRRLTGGRPLNPLSSRTVKKHLSPKYAGGGMISLNGSHHCYIYPQSRKCFEPVLCDTGAYSSVHVQILGFWMGPDIVEDGCGFVEASVHRIC